MLEKGFSYGQTCTHCYLLVLLRIGTLTALVAWKGYRMHREVYIGCRCFPKAGRAFATCR